jgi:hypothetical protein
MVPVLVSSLVVIFAVVEVLILPFIAQTFCRTSRWWPAPGWASRSRPTAPAIAAGGITESLILAQNAAEGVKYQAGWILGTTATIKVFIDIFIGVWAFVLGYIWTNHIKPPAKRPRPEIWERFPKFIIGFIVTFRGRSLSRARDARGYRRQGARRDRRGQHLPRHLLHPDVLLDRCLSNFKRLWAEGIGKLAAVYFVSLFGFVIWVGLLISWLFFAGIKPPLAS